MDANHSVRISMRIWIWRTKVTLNLLIRNKAIRYRDLNDISPLSRNLSDSGSTLIPTRYEMDTFVCWFGCCLLAIRIMLCYIEFWFSQYYIGLHRLSLERKPSLCPVRDALKYFNCVPSWDIGIGIGVGIRDYCPLEDSRLETYLLLVLEQQQQRS